MMAELYSIESDRQIRKNIQLTYVFKLQEVTRQLRQMEKEHLVKVQNLYGPEGEVFLNSIERKEEDFFAELDLKKDERKRDHIVIDQIGESSKARSADFERLMKQINELAILFKDLSTLVVEQGTILDRIDFNIEESHKNVKGGLTELKKTLARENSRRAQGCMSCLIVNIVVCVALLVLKNM